MGRPHMGKDAKDLGGLLGGRCGSCRTSTQRVEPKTVVGTALRGATRSAHPPGLQFQANHSVPLVSNKL